MKLGTMIRGRGPVLEDYSMDQRRAMWPPAKPLQQRHIDRCRLIEDRLKMLDLMPKNAVCAEVGVLKGDFSQQILDRMQPRKLHLIDISADVMGRAAQRFATDIGAGKVELHCGDSTATLLSMPNEHFDWIYIDGDHTYGQVKRDLEAARVKIKRDGLIALNDYVFFGASDFVKYGVVEAVNEFCIDHDFEMKYFALQGRMYNDVVLGRLQG